MWSNTVSSYLLVVIIVYLNVNRNQSSTASVLFSYQSLQQTTCSKCPHDSLLPLPLLPIFTQASVILFTGGGVADTPKADTSPGQTPPCPVHAGIHPPRRPLQRTVRILLECILVTFTYLPRFQCDAKWKSKFQEIYVAFSISLLGNRSLTGNLAVFDSSFVASVKNSIQKLKSWNIQALSSYIWSN